MKVSCKHCKGTGRKRIRVKGRKVCFQFCEKCNGKGHKEKPLKAFKVLFNEVIQLVSATSASKARYTAYLHCKDYFDNVNITQFKVRRCPEYDKLAISEGFINEDEKSKDVYDKLKWS